MLYTITDIWLCHQRKNYLLIEKPELYFKKYYHSCHSVVSRHPLDNLLLFRGGVSQGQ